MQVIEVFFDVSATIAALGAGAALFRTSGRLRSAEAKRNALQSRLTEIEQQRTSSATEADAAFATLQSSNQRLLETANRRVAELEKALESAEKQQALSIRRVEALEKSLVLEQAKAVLTVPVKTPIPIAPTTLMEVPATPAAIEIPEAPPLRAVTNSVKKVATIVLVAASRESKSAGDMETHLTDAGYRVVRATSITNVMTAARKSRPDLVTLDAQIAGGDSLEALAKFKADPELRDIPVVVVCALKDRDRAIEMGAAGCVAPPFTSNVLQGTVKTAFISHKKRMERSRLAKTANTAPIATAPDRPAALSGVE